MTTVSREEEIKDIHIQYKDFYRIGGGLFVIIILAMFGSWLFGQNQLSLADNMLGYVTNVATEALSVIATIVVIDQLDRRRQTQERNLALFRQAKSRSNDHALEALSQIQNDDLWDALLEHYRDDTGRIDLSSVQWAGGVQLQEHDFKEADLRYANLQSADLYQANLQSSDLSYANLQSVNLWNANLQSADLRYTNLQSAYLGDAYLQSADLRYTNLQSADLRDAYLQSADLRDAYLQSANLRDAYLQSADLRDTYLQSVNLWNANLQEANLWNANLRDAKFNPETKFNEKTVLPDAEYLEDDEDGNRVYSKYWTPDTDMRRYTDPEHPDFWQPQYFKRGKNIRRPRWVTDDMLVD